jgi:uncharacterized protein with HEPN domain
MTAAEGQWPATMTSAAALNVILAAVQRALSSSDTEDTVYQRYETLKTMRDYWIDEKFFTIEGKMLITTANQEIARLRPMVPSYLQEIKNVDSS